MVISIIYTIHRVISHTHIVGCAYICTHTYMCMSVEISVVCENFPAFTGFHYWSSEKIHMLEVKYVYMWRRNCKFCYKNLCRERVAEYFL